ncbi:hypothetical protein L210DRAFT_3586959 [Boletus edulis BED1]|uniref:Uncharacterized protein n=1 Tax=Boletus edulis BED1 TaxID=1328754 RepID=A0AAD4G4Z2_BOLED|nr:hypothetical protein L210DRAFT_3586959 [Boletus edulis BED1]
MSCGFQWCPFVPRFSMFWAPFWHLGCLMIVGLSDHAQQFFWIFRRVVGLCPPHHHHHRTGG